MTTKLIGFSLLLFWTTAAAEVPNFYPMSFDQSECIGDYYGDMTTNVIKKINETEFQVTMSLNGAFKIENPKNWVRKGSLSLMVDMGAPGGGAMACRCKKSFSFTLKSADIKEVKKAYIIVNSIVYDEVEIEH
jgi:hypothetical protein